MMLSEVVSVARRFQRSVRVDKDLGTAAALNGFVCQGSNKNVLETMAKLMVETEQKAFTWTGPYGGGKSSLALALCASIGGDRKLRKHAKSVLGNVPDLEPAFPVGNEGWLVVPLIGRRSDPIADIRDALAGAVAAESGAARTRRRKADKTGRDVIERLRSEAAGRPRGGVLVLIDEMGKFLEGAAAEGTDIHFFQELAEAAGRCEGRLVVLGILHQSFEQYASRMGRDVQDEWAKVQGRYVDIPMVTAIDEVIDLIGQAIVTESEHPESLVTAEKVADAIRLRRPGSPDDLATRLDVCWPLHPVTAALLGPVSRRRFGQNERSTFGFLGSSEPEGFQEFLRGVVAGTGETYDAARLWDYLRINLEPTILASPDGHRWAQGAEAVERCESKGSALHIRLAKTIALIDLFRNGSGVVPERTVLQACLGEVAETLVDEALEDLETWSVVVFRKHLNAWAIYAGSDFDITEAVEAAKASESGLNLARLARLADLQPLPAKEHYYRSGTLRWFETDLVTLGEAKEAVRSFEPRNNGSSGKFLLAMPEGGETREKVKDTCRRISEEAGIWPVAVGIPLNAWLIRELGGELVALESVQANRPELEGDQVARREIAARIASVSAELEEELRASFNEATWFVRGKCHEGPEAPTLARLISRLADETFPEAPVVHSELVNREKPSSNSQAAVRLLLHAMVSKGGDAYLAIDGYPAERGLYSTILETAGMHGRGKNGLGFKSPSGRKPVGRSFLPMWRKAEELLEKAEEPVSLTQLYAAWTAPPYGVRRGLLPILAVAFILAHESSMAVYSEGTFQPAINDFVADRLLQDEGLIALRFVVSQVENDRLLEELRQAIGEITGKIPPAEPLAVARALVEFVFRLAPWTQLTSALSKAAQGVRRVLLNANDPNRALFVDLPNVVEPLKDETPGAAITAALHELAGAYPAMLDDLCQRMLNALEHKGSDFGELRRRAGVVSGVSGDLRHEAFATRIAEFDGSREDMESIAGLVARRPTRDWSDMDPNQAALELAELALRFRQTELLARVQGREPTQHAVAVVFGTGEAGRTVMKSFNLPETERVEVEDLAEKVIGMLKESGVDGELLLAALAEAGLRAADEAETNTNTPNAVAS